MCGYIFQIVCISLPSQDAITFFCVIWLYLSSSAFDFVDKMISSSLLFAFMCHDVNNRVCWIFSSSFMAYGAFDVSGLFSTWARRIFWESMMHLCGVLNIHTQQVGFGSCRIFAFLVDWFFFFFWSKRIKVQKLLLNALHLILFRLHIEGQHLINLVVSLGLSPCP